MTPSTRAPLEATERERTIVSWVSVAQTIVWMAGLAIGNITGEWVWVTAIVLGATMAAVLGLGFWIARSHGRSVGDTMTAAWQTSWRKRT